MEIRARSLRTKEAVNKFAAVTLKNTQLLKLIIIDVGYSLLMGAVMRSAVHALLLFIILTTVIAVLLLVSVKKTFKLLGKFQGAVNYYLFRDNDFTCSSTTLDGAYHSNAVIYYSFPVKAIETTDYLFIYIQKNRAYIIDKRTIENGTIDDIRGKLIPQLGKNYKMTK